MGPLGGDIVGEFFDIGQSRSLPWERREEASRVLHALKDPDRGWDGLVIGEATRCWFSDQFSLTWPMFDRYGVSLWIPSLGGRFDPENTVHDMAMTITGGLSKSERSASITVDEVAEAAAVPVIDELRGRAVEMYVALKPGYRPSRAIEEKVAKAIETEIGKIARPKSVWIVSDMPKTRSGKIMRRVIAAISNFADIGDVTTLANPEIVEDTRHHVQNEKVTRGEVPRQLSEQEIAEIKALCEAE